ncbi:MAG TPA: response regulator [Chryseosolibacter sp.]
MHILYIDDDLEDREIFKEAIAEIGPSYVCNLAADGKQGIDALQEFVVMPDYIFVDVNMPVMNGKQFLEKVKSTPQLRSIPVIMYSTTNYAQERIEYFNLGARDVLIKPNTFQDICELLKSVLEHGKMQNTLMQAV